jgi:hypothetical protein
MITGINFIAIYAAVISTISIFWNIYSYFDSKRGRVRILINFETEWESTDKYSICKCKYISVSLVNHGESKRVLNSISIYVENMIYSDSYSMPQQINLEPKLPFNFKIPYNEIVTFGKNAHYPLIFFFYSPKLAKFLNKGKMEIIAKETTGQEYKKRKHYIFRKEFAIYYGN